MPVSTENKQVSRCGSMYTECWGYIWKVLYVLIKVLGDVIPSEEEQDSLVQYVVNHFWLLLSYCFEEIFKTVWLKVNH